MNKLNASVLYTFVLSVVLFSLTSCASFGKPATALTPRSESVCDQTPPAPIPPIPDTQPDIFEAFMQVIGLYRDEVTKYLTEKECRQKVREENTKAHK